jgi:hypothetical protein
LLGEVAEGLTVGSHCLGVVWTVWENHPVCPSKETITPRAYLLVKRSLINRLGGYCRVIVYKLSRMFLCPHVSLIEEGIVFRDMVRHPV